MEGWALSSSFSRIFLSFSSVCFLMRSGIFIGTESKKFHLRGMKTVTRETTQSLLKCNLLLSIQALSVYLHCQTFLGHLIPSSQTISECNFCILQTVRGHQKSRIKTNLENSTDILMALYVCVQKYQVNMELIFYLSVGDFQMEAIYDSLSKCLHLEYPSFRTD